MLNQDRSLKSTVHLPSSTQVTLRTKNFNVYEVQGTAAEKERDGWLYLLKASIEKQAVDNWISCSAFRANSHHASIPPPAIHALLPLFTNSTHSIAMLRHSMDITKAAVQCLNPGQTCPNSLPATIYNAQRNTMGVQSAAGKDDVKAERPTCCP